MSLTYEVIINDNNQEVIKRTDLDGKIWWIPALEENSDYQAYLKWQEEQGINEQSIKYSIYTTE